MHIMNQSLRPFIGKFMVVYFDDIRIFNSSLTDHLSHIREVLCFLRYEQRLPQNISASLVFQKSYFVIRCFWESFDDRSI